MLLALLAFGVVWCVDRRPPRHVVRPGRSSPRPVDDERSWAERPLLRTITCASAGLVVGAVMMGGLGAAFGMFGGMGMSWWVGRWEPAHVARDRSRIERDLPMTADLLAACVKVGVPVEQALQQIARAASGPLAERLTVLVARIELGADPTAQWRQLAGDPALGGLARALARAAQSGAPPADSLLRFAADSRRRLRSRQLERARGVGVRCAAPLALCFLPAFMLVGVVPTVVGAFANLPW